MSLVYVSSLLGANQFNQNCEVPLHFLPSTASTNTYAMQQLSHLQVGQWYACWTDHQTAGRGRQNRAWFSEPGASLCLSVGGVFAAQQPLPSGLSVGVGAAVANSLSRLGVPVGLKWPNDIVVGDAKLAGILCEATHSGKLQRVVLGVGVNVKPFARASGGVGQINSAFLEADLALAITSLACHGVIVALDELAQQLTAACAQVLQLVFTSPESASVDGSHAVTFSGLARQDEGLHFLLQRARQLDVLAGQPVRVVDALGDGFDASALGIDPYTGAYRVLSPTGELLLSVGELRLRKHALKHENYIQNM